MRHAMLALLAKEPAHGYELKLALEQQFGVMWPPVNIGQIYTTLSRLERDGLVRSAHVAQDARPDKRVFELTAEGRAELFTWMEEPAEGVRVKDEFFTKLMLARRAGVADPITLIDRQRGVYLKRLKELHTLAVSVSGDVAASLAIEGAVLHLQADLKWLERCERALD